MAQNVNGFGSTQWKCAVIDYWNQHLLLMRRVIYSVIPLSLKILYRLHCCALKINNNVNFNGKLAHIILSLSSLSSLSVSPLSSLSLSLSVSVKWIEKATSGRVGALSEMRQGMNDDQYGCQCFLWHETLGLQITPKTHTHTQHIH